MPARTLNFSKKYQHLVRNNSVFWLASGYNLDFGLIGGVVKTGTFPAAGNVYPDWPAAPAGRLAGSQTECHRE
jgi:paraquat-inducible protein B